MGVRFNQPCLNVLCCLPTEFYCHDSLVCLWFQYFWCTVLQTTGSHICSLARRSRLPGDCWRRDIKTLMSATWVIVLRGDTYHTVFRMWRLDSNGCRHQDTSVIRGSFIRASGVFHKDWNSRCASFYTWNHYSCRFPMNPQYFGNICFFMPIYLQIFSSQFFLHAYASKD